MLGSTKWIRADWSYLRVCRSGPMRFGFELPNSPAQTVGASARLRCVRLKEVAEQPKQHDENDYCGDASAAEFPGTPASDEGFKDITHRVERAGEWAGGVHRVRAGCCESKSYPVMTL